MDPRLARGNGPVILIVVDALRPDHMSAYGFPRDTTPHLLALANEGVVFTNYYVNSNWTRPSMATILSGLLAKDHGVRKDDDRLRASIDTLPELLQRAGIPTGAVVGNGNAAGVFGLDQGFDSYADTTQHWQGLPTAPEVLELAQEYVVSHQHQPFFLMVFLVDPHDPYQAPPDYEARFVRHPEIPLVRSPHWELGRYDVAQAERMQDTYDAAVRFTDDALGSFFAFLRKLHLYDSATIIVTADHAEGFGEHGYYLHSHHLYDEFLRVPLIVRAPRMARRGGYWPRLTQSIDLAPTILELYGLRAPDAWPGTSLSARSKVRPPVLAEFVNFGIRRKAARTITHKLIMQEPADVATFMATVGDARLLPSVSFTETRLTCFDLQRDPLERHDLCPGGLPPGTHWRRLKRLLDAYPLAQDPTSPEHIVRHIDPEVRRDLRALGYIQ